MIVEKLFEVMRSAKNGLNILQLPTGFGKTHAAIEAIKRYIGEDNPRQVIFVTNLKKNLPNEKDMIVRQDVVEDDSEDVAYLETDENTEDLLKELGAEKAALRLEANEDMAEKAYKANAFDKVSMEFQTENFEKLKEIFDVLKQIESDKSRSNAYDRFKSIKAYKDSRREDVQKLLKEWGLEIVKTLYELEGCFTAKTKKEIINTKYKWVSQIYPAVNVGEAKIVLMSIDKLYWGKTTLLDNCGFLSETFLKDKIIVIDEFDATKANLRNCILNKKNSTIDYIGLFHEIYNATTNRPNKKLSQCIKNVEETAKDYKNGGGFRWNVIVEEAQRLNEEYHLNYNFQVPKSQKKNKDRNILFRDGKFLTLNRKYLRLKVDEDEGVVNILPLSEAESEKAKFSNKENLVIMMGQISGFIKFFAHFISAMSYEYKKIEDASRKERLEKEGVDMEEMTIEQSIRTLLKALHISSGHRNENSYDSVQEQLLELCMSTQIKGRKAKKRNPLTPYSYFRDGYSYYETIDSNNHNEDTYLKMTSVLETPESNVAMMATNSTVIGLSATATLNSVTGNYSIEFFKEELGEDYHDLIMEDGDLRTTLQEEFENHYMPYHNGQINVTTEIVDCNKSNYELRLKELFSEEDDALKALKIIENDDEGYNRGRYAGLVTVMMRFAKCENDRVRTLLYLGQASVKEDVTCKVKRNILERLLKLVNKECGREGENEVILECLNANEFEKTKQDIQTTLSNTKKRVFICSTYACIGAGQNLQYDSSDEGLVKLPPKKGDNRKYEQRDIDWIYIGDITHLSKKATEDENIVLAEELYEHSEISPSEKERLIENAFNKNKAYQNPNVVSKTESIKAERTRTVIQGVGRTDRTNLKSDDIRIEIDKVVFDNLSRNVLHSDFQSPLVESLKEAYDGQHPEVDREETCYNMRKAELRAVKFNSYLSKMLYKDWNHWSKDEIESWQKLRQVVLKHPTADSEIYEDEEVVRDYYINDGDNNINKYSFITKNGDKRFYTELKIPFGNETLVPNSNEIMLEVSAGSARLDQVLNYPGMRAYFEEKEYATSFKENKYIMSPTMFTNIYKGALGEEAGKFILEYEIGIRLADMDQDKYEYFDYQIEGHEGIYIDFKHWRSCMLQNTEEVMEHIMKKKEKIGAKKVLIIGLLNEGDGEARIVTNVSGIITVPYLIDENGVVNESFINELRKTIL
ncbi:MAG: hypothetical protein J6I79_09145 [Paludibacteraceae bacterium]|nr:hypothetical protein [Paludibacteraceae bacterium]